ncbi:MAG TPA: YlxR family protein [Lapillicoccus sp.]|uniref:YlxR family protein n=1 Tax=Lapillicoccus sp. TaxID=1909287 RepID=UPI002F93759E
MTDRSGLPVSVPVRTCVGCRRRDSWSALLRVVAVREEPDNAMNGVVVLVPDPRHRLPGRGAWLHPSTTCFEQAVRRKAFTRALRLQAGPDVSRVADHLETAGRTSMTTPITTDHDRPTEGGSDADEHSMSTQQ